MSRPKTYSCYKEVYNYHQSPDINRQIISYNINTIQVLGLK